MDKENKLDDLIYEIEAKMKRYNILKKELYVIINRNTVSKIFTNHEGTIETLRKIINYVDNVINEKK